MYVMSSSIFLEDLHEENMGERRATVRIYEVKVDQNTLSMGSYSPKLWALLANSELNATQLPFERA